MGPRIFGLPATASPVIAVIRRGPSGWCHVGRWDPEAPTDAGRWQSGAWIHATIYPQRCDLSPDGEILAAFLLQPGARWSAGGTYISLSRLPWLTALAAWGTNGTWTRGVAIVPKGTATHRLNDPPDEGHADAFLDRWDLELRRPRVFAVERTRGWTETADSPAADEVGDPWDERRAVRVTMQKARPTEPGLRLLVGGRYGAFREGEPGRAPVQYWLERERERDLVPLPDVQWADWGRDGRLLIATLAGHLRIHDEPEAAVHAGGVPAWELDLAALRPERTPPPATRA